ncbi:hypothetical protein C8Q78DRAFT_514411 [Trametes maxima]|nr:hypothetical protein C8Q78DRAFT_514411 [Trametes maxima]
MKASTRKHGTTGTNASATVRRYLGRSLSSRTSCVMSPRRTVPPCCMAAPDRPCGRRSRWRASRSCEHSMSGSQSPAAPIRRRSDDIGPLSRRLRGPTSRGAAQLLSRSCPYVQSQPATRPQSLKGSFFPARHSQPKEICPDPTSHMPRYSDRNPKK